MKKYLIVDLKMRKQEQDFLKSLGYRLIYTCISNNVYAEISSHVDIFCSKIGDNLILEPNFFKVFTNLNEYNEIKNKVNVISGSTYISDCATAYNVCALDNFLISNIKSTDTNVINIAKKNNLEIIDVKQKYAKCSVSKLNCNNFVTLDKGIKKRVDIFKKEKSSNDSNRINALYLPQQDFNIKLINSYGKYSSMCGFLGGATCVIDDKYIIFGDIENVEQPSRNIIIDFVKKCGLELIDFKGLDIIDYGGVIEL